MSADPLPTELCVRCGHPAVEHLAMLVHERARVGMFNVLVCPTVQFLAEPPESAAASPPAEGGANATAAGTRKHLHAASAELLAEGETPNTLLYPGGSLPYDAPPVETLRGALETLYEAADAIAKRLSTQRRALTRKPHEATLNLALWKAWAALEVTSDEARARLQPPAKGGKG